MGLTRTSFFLLAVLGVAVFHAPPTSAKNPGHLVDRIDAIVGAEIITRDDLREFTENYQRRKQIDPLLSLSTEPKKIHPGYLLELLIREKLIRQYLKEVETEITNEMVNQQILQIQSTNNLTRNQLKQALQLEGYSFEAYFEHMRSSLATNTLIEREIRPKIRITEDDLKEVYFREHVRKEIPIRYRISHILIDPAAYRTAAAALEFAKNIRERILAGEPFADLAKAYSNDGAAEAGGDLGVVGLSSLSRPLASAVQDLRIGQVSEVIRTPAGYHLVRVEDKLAGVDKDFLDKRERIRNQIYREQLVRLLEDWFQTQRQATYVRIVPMG